MTMTSAHELSRTTEASYRQLDYWTRKGIIRPDQEARGSGSQRGFGETEARIVKLVAALRVLYNMRLEMLGEVAGQARRWTDEEWHGPIFIDRAGHVTRWPISMCVSFDLDELFPADRVA